MDHTPGGAQECEPVGGDAQLSEIQLLKRAWQHSNIRRSGVKVGVGRIIGEKNEQQWKNTKSKFLYKISPE